jgi:RNA polymerase sigma-70 factor (family 1)
MKGSYDNTNGYSDKELVLRFQNADTSAFRCFYERHYDTMYLAAYHLLRDEEDARDAVQELFSSIWQHADRLDPNGNIKGYLYTVLRNRIMTHMSRSKYFDEYINSYMAYEKQEKCVTEESVLVRELEQLLEEKINQLPPKMREVYRLSSYEHLSNQEIAHRMDIAEGTVKQHKHQATQILRRKLQHLVGFWYFIVAFFIN